MSKLRKINSEISPGSVTSGILSVADSKIIYARVSVNVEILSPLELRQKLYNQCNKTKDASNEVLGKWSAGCEALQDKLKAAAARNAEQKQSTEVLKQQLANLKVKAAKKDEAIDKMEKIKNQFRSELEQLDHYNLFLANECQNTILPLMDKILLLETQRPKQRLRSIIRVLKQ